MERCSDCCSLARAGNSITCAPRCARIAATSASPKRPAAAAAASARSHVLAHRNSWVALGGVAPEAFHPPVFSLDVISGADGQSLIRAAGELDRATVDEFTTAVRAALTRGGVIVDLSALEFMDSSGVRALNTALREAAEQRRELRVREAMQPSVVQILELTDMLSLLPMERAR